MCDGNRPNTVEFRHANNKTEFFFFLLPSQSSNVSSCKVRSLPSPHTHLPITLSLLRPIFIIFFLGLLFFSLHFFYEPSRYNIDVWYTHHGPTDALFIIYYMRAMLRHNATTIIIIVKNQRRRSVTTTHHKMHDDAQWHAVYI